MIVSTKRDFSTYLVVAARALELEWRALIDRPGQILTFVICCVFHCWQVCECVLLTLSLLTTRYKLQGRVGLESTAKKVTLHNDQKLCMSLGVNTK
jgi:hypothetical protein